MSTVAPAERLRSKIADYLESLGIEHREAAALFEVPYGSASTSITAMQVEDELNGASTLLVFMSILSARIAPSQALFEYIAQNQPQMGRSASIPARQVRGLSAVGTRCPATTLMRLNSDRQ